MLRPRPTLDEPTAQLMAEKGVWGSLQPFVDDGPSAHSEGPPNRLKQLQLFAGTDTAQGLTKKSKIKAAWETDVLFSATPQPSNRAASQDGSMVHAFRRTKDGNRRQSRVARFVWIAKSLLRQVGLLSRKRPWPTFCLWMGTHRKQQKRNGFTFVLETVR
jgi:hypothetical protein